MSGNNKIYIIFLWLLLFISSCSVSKRQFSPRTPKDSQITTRVDTLQRLDSLMLIAQDTLSDTLISALKDSYDIAIVLPLLLDSLYADTSKYVNEKIYPQSVMGLEIYQGILLALEDFKKQKTKLTLHVYDSKNHQKTVEQIIENPAFKKMDLIIGPVYNNNLRIMAEFAKENEIYMVSPLSPADNITSGNPYYIMMNPTIEVHCRKIFDYVIENYYDANVIIISQPSSVEWEYTQFFGNYLADFQRTTGNYDFIFTEILSTPEEDNKDNTEEQEDFSEYFEYDKNNVVIVPSVDRPFIHNISRKLNALDKYDITLIGLPVWGDYNTMRLDYTEKLNVHFTSSFWMDDSFYSWDNNFYKTFLDNFYIEPSEFAIKGYDLLSYFGNLLIKYGSDFGKKIPEEPQSVHHTDFIFKPTPVKQLTLYAHTDSLRATDSIAPVNFIENKYVHLLRFRDYTIQKMN